jgi:hypothetical protein
VHNTAFAAPKYLATLFQPWITLNAEMENLNIFYFFLNSLDTCIPSVGRFFFQHGISTTEYDKEVQIAQ